VSVRRRSVLAWLLAVTALPSLESSTRAQAGAAASGAQEPRVIDIVARRFRYEPSHIVLRRGEAVTLRFQSLDFLHGFSVPDWHLRADLPPGLVTEVHIQPQQAGTVAFLCDNFCGEGHEGMSGEFVIE